MAWMPRRKKPIPPEHWTCTVDSRDCPGQQFIDFSSTRQMLLEEIREAGLICHAWSLSRVHLELVTGGARNGNTRAVLEGFLERFADYWQEQYCLNFRLGAVRIRRTVLRCDADLLAAMQSVELAPLKGTKLRNPNEYLYSSCLWHTQGTPDALVVDPMAYVRLGIDAQARQFVYHEQLARQCVDPVQTAVHAELSSIKRERAKAQRRI